MADLSSNFIGIKSPNPFWLASAPPTDKEYNVERAFKAGWGAVEEPLIYTQLGSSPGIQSRSRPLRIGGVLIRRAPSWLGRAVGESFYRYAA